MSLSTHQKSVLYQNSSKTIMIIDIPTSIAEAQMCPRTPNSHHSRKLLSTEPRREPFVSTEPKSEKGRQSLAQRNAVDLFAGEKYVRLIEEGIEVVRRDWVGEWCLERRVLRAGGGRKRKRGWEKELGSAEGSGVINDFARGEGYVIEESTKAENFLRGEERISMVMKAIEEEQLEGLNITITSPSSNTSTEPEPEIIDLISWDGIYYNEDSHPVLLSITKDEKEPTAFHIPPFSAFVLSNCTQSSKFRNTIRLLSSTYSRPRTFNFILLDPPWPNASAKRKSSYSTASQLRDLKKLLLGMDLDTHLASSGYVGIWITNAPAIRNLVLGPGGLLEAWNATLIEEWIWVKTTISGDLVTDINGLWRKPYEVLLIGRAPASRMEVAQELEEEDVVKRVIFGVPDLHSRKPCLKSLIEGCGIVKEGGRVLEVFARYCVAGWWSWGNEVLKHNWDGYWEDDEKRDEIEDIQQR
jgi:N6-adenosine-specific RNA methylase IME4